MSIVIKCPNCGYVNAFILDQFMGLYVACENCSLLIKVVPKSPSDEEPTERPATPPREEDA